MWCGQPRYRPRGVETSGVRAPRMGDQQEYRGQSAPAPVGGPGTMATRVTAKKDFATRLSAETLARLDELVRSGRYKTRTAAIEAAVERLCAAEQEEYERKRRALDEAFGMFHL